MIRLNDVPIKELGMFVLQEGNTHPSPTFENKTVKVPGRIGEYHFGSEVGSRPHTIALGVIDPDVIESQARVRKFFELVLDEYGKPKPVKMVYEYEPDKYYTVYVDGSFIPERMRGYINGPINLVAYDPIAYSIVRADEVTWGSEDITFESTAYTLGHTGAPSKMRITGPITLNCEVIGNAVQPIIDIRGNADNLNLSVGNQSFSIGSFTDTEWTIEGKSFTVIKNGQNVFDELEGDFLWFKKGVNELVVDGSNIDIDLTVTYHDEFS